MANNSPSIFHCNEYTVAVSCLTIISLLPAVIDELVTGCPFGSEHADPCIVLHVEKNFEKTVLFRTVTSFTMRFAVLVGYFAELFILKKPFSLGKESNVFGLGSPTSKKSCRASSKRYDREMEIIRIFRCYYFLTSQLIPALRYVIRL